MTSVHNDRYAMRRRAGNPRLVGRTVLILESSADVADVIREMLEAEGCLVVSHLHPQQGLQQFAESPESFDIVLLDVSVAHFSYLRVAEQIWARADIPITLICGLERTSLRTHLPGRVFAGRVYKPFRRDDLIGALAAAVSGVPIEE